MHNIIAEQICINQSKQPKRMGKIAVTGTKSKAKQINKIKANNKQNNTGPDDSSFETAKLLST